LGILISVIDRLRVCVDSTCRSLGIGSTIRCSIATITPAVAIALASVAVATIATLATVAAVTAITVSWSATSVAIPVATVAARHWPALERFIVLLYLVEELVAEKLGLLYALRSGSPEIVSIQTRRFQ
jgi:hypothetical protein